MCYLRSGGGSVSRCSTGPSGRALGACSEACRSSEAGHHGWGGLGVCGGLRGVRQGWGHLRGQMRWHPLSHHPRGPAAWRPNRRDVWDTDWSGAAWVGLHGDHGLRENCLRDGGCSCRHHGGGTWLLLLLLQSPLLLLFGPVVLNQLGMILLLLPDLNTETTQHSQRVEFKLRSLFTLNEGVAAYLLQLFLHRPLLLSDAAELGGVLLSKDSSGLLGCSLLGRQSFLGLAVGCDLVLQETLLHLQELLRLRQPLLVLTPLRLVCRKHSRFILCLMLL